MRARLTSRGTLRASVSARNFGRVVKGDNLRLHPVVAGLVDKETLKKMRNEQAEGDV